MSKRESTGEDERPPKRPRQEHSSQPPKVEEIHFARQLQDLLIFRQDGIQQLRNGVASFKAFLESILYHKEEDHRGRQISILREYLETQKPSEKDTERPFLPQLWQAWSFANQNNNDHLASSISAVLALLLKTLSGVLDLREHGVLLGRTVLQHQHLRLIKRCLDAPKHKDFIISPSLRLLTEVTSFDGGVLARQVYKRREETFDINNLRRLLGVVKLDISEEEARRKPALRTLTLRYILTLLKYLHEGGKIDVLKNKPLCGAMFQHIQDDPSDLVAELLNTMEQSILKDAELPRSSKAALLTPQNLERVTSIASRGNEAHSASDRAYVWLKTVCTHHVYGVFRKSGWYPPGTSHLNSTGSDKLIQLGLDSIEFYDSAESINVRNPILLSWIQTLRAQSNERERELLITCFASAPELVAAYFSQKPFQLEPKLSNTWIGYASLMFEVVNLPVPENFGDEEEIPNLPPQTSIAVESILPRPLNRGVLTRCLNQSSGLITFFAVRILVKAFEKLSIVLSQLRRGPHTEQALWDEAAERLRERSDARCPAMKDVIAAYRKIPDDHEHAMQREAATKLVSLYYEVSPVQALEEQFDVSVALATALRRSEKAGANDEELRTFRALELEHLLNIARHGTNMRWFNKQGSLEHPPSVALLRIHRKDKRNKQIRSLLGHVLTENGILNQQKVNEGPSPLDALVASTLDLQDGSSVWAFVEDCFTRCVRQPVKYVDSLEAISADGKGSIEGVKTNLPSLLTAVLLEQASFVAAQSDTAGKERQAWIVQFLGLLSQTSDDCEILRQLSTQATQTLGLKIKKADKTSAKALLADLTIEETGTSAAEAEQTVIAGETPVQLPYEPPQKEASSHPELLRWSQKDLELAIEDGDVDALILDLCSEQVSVRKQAATQINKLKFQLRAATSQENSAQLALLVGELMETFEQQYTNPVNPMPYIAGTFAVRALHVQTQPQHFIYPKLNHFLIRGPEWRANTLPSYWLSTTVLDQPKVDDAYWREAQWVLDWLVDGLRTPADLEILRRGSIFEKLLGLWISPGAASHKQIREKCFELVFRASCVESGSDFLITRIGILSWLDMVSTSDAKAAVLKDRILETCDTERIQAWKGGRKASKIV
ncbi:related to URB1 Nucleolar required for the normal accumulation of 25S and rRNAs [Lecanosticta acicola]|uniref:Related to URB1 Nucleolar required for the normal accumulation of 25S and rRNAs n=1 Tax=Lecanosticta acicola TaxID=111012 RepID=A0AAI8YVS9_9PEZI|nr:related to URB1 Nucleolar required for the normal accumulation of 25S and rRNAs [Lecanosticta acicola]